MSSTNTSAFGILMDRWLDDPAFRVELRADPDQWAAVRRQLTLSDEELQARVSKGLTGN